MRPPRAPRETLEALFRAALAAAEPGAALRRAVSRAGERLTIAGRDVPRGARLRVLAAGKAALAMASELERIAGDRIVGGLVVTPTGHGAGGVRLARREAGHPIPDVRSEAAGRAILAAAGEGAADEILVVLLSGGASSLLACPLPGISREDLAHTTALLLASGAPIEAFNCVRKHLCEVAGGRLARAARGRSLLLLALSDVIGDRLEVIGSGPCTPDPTTYADACAVLHAHGLAAQVPTPVLAHLEAGARGERVESAKRGEDCFARLHGAVVASNREALEAAAGAAASLGLRVILLRQPLRGEASTVGRRLGALARAVRPLARTLLLAGGETTVTLRGNGRGGRNQELALAAAIALEGLAGATLLAAGTDGTDGPTDAAGAVVDGGSVARAAALGADAAAALRRNDSYGLFAVEGGLLRTGPTGTNVMDLAFLLLDPAGL